MRPNVKGYDVCEHWLENACRRKTMVEIVWKGKYDDAGRKAAPVRVQLPLQTIETVNESTQDRQKRLERFLSGREDTEWRNRLIWGDNKYVLPAVFHELGGKIKLIYIDPPFATGADFSFTAAIPDDPDNEDGTSAFIKQPSILEQKAYRDTWGHGAESYLQMIYERLALMRDLLTDDGSIYIHVDPTMGHYVKCVADEIFGSDNFHSEIIWRRSNSHNKLTGQFGPIHDSILFYSKSPEFEFHPGTTPFSKGYVESRFVYRDARGIYQPNYLTGPGIRTGDSGKPWRGFDPTRNGRHWAIPSRLIELLREDVSKMSTQEILETLERNDLLVIPKKKGGQPMYKQYLTEGVPYQDIWAYVANSQGLVYGSRACMDEDVKWLEQEQEKLNYPTQKPEGVLRRIVQTSSSEGDIVGDFFCGSGTAAAVAEKMGRRWIACDLSRFAVHTTRKRLLGIQDLKPFEIQNLGKYERQAWQSMEFGNDAGQRVRSYISFVLKLYSAQPLNGYLWLHGKKGNRLVHVGSVDSPISPLDVGQIVAEFKRSIGTGIEAPKTNGVDVLGWDFAFELNELAKQQAAMANVDVRFFRIPREVLDKKAVEQGDVHFFELASLDVVTKTSGKTVRVAIKDFVIPPDDVPSDIQKSVSHWSQWIDYWSVDWNHKEDTFHNEWQEYRTLEKPQLQTESSKTYDEHGNYRVVVKVIDILGNDTTKILSVKI